MAFAYTQYEPMYSDSAQSMVMSTEATHGIYIPLSGSPVFVQAAPSKVLKTACGYCATRHLYDREKVEETLMALLCLACGAPLPYPEE